MDAAVRNFEESIVGIRLGQVSPSLIDTFKVNAYGQQTPIKHVASSGVEGGGIRVRPHDPSLAPVIRDALTGAGFNAYLFDKNCVAVSVPPASGDEREKVKTRVRGLAEDAKVAVRNVRKAARQGLDKALSQNEKKGAENRIQEATDHAVAEIDKIVAAKLKAIG